jgi:hypothetical protein
MEAAPTPDALLELIVRSLAASGSSDGCAEAGFFQGKFIEGFPWRRATWLSQVPFDLTVML